jgi:hypothetical protein
MSTGLPVSTPNKPPSCKQPHVLSPKDKSAFFSSAMEELKLLNFKSQKGVLLLEEVQHLAQLYGEGSSTGGKGLGKRP